MTSVELILSTTFSQELRNQTSDSEKQWGRQFFVKGQEMLGEWATRPRASKWPLRILSAGDELVCGIFDNSRSHFLDIRNCHDLRALCLDYIADRLVLRLQAALQAAAD
jgi:hypothetical protein